MRSTSSLTAVLLYGFLLSVLPLGAEEALPERLSVPMGATKLEFVLIPAGSFVQGVEDASAPDSAGREVRISRAFYMQVFPVTRGQYEEYVRQSGYRTEAEIGTSGGFGWDGAKLTQRKDFTWRNPGFVQQDDHPVVMMTHGDAQAFAQWLTRKAGRTFLLPTEAQWEYAAKGGKSGVAIRDGAILSARKKGTRPVHAASLNAWGVGDLLGNTWQWCGDWFAPYPEGSATDPYQIDATLSDKPRRVIRGGSWMKSDAECSVTTRFRNDPGSRNADNGFRLIAVTATPPVQRTPERPSRAVLPISQTTPTLERENVSEPSDSNANTTHTESSSEAMEVMVEKAKRREKGSWLTTIPCCVLMVVAVFFLVKFFTRLLKTKATSIPNEFPANDNFRSGPASRRSSRVRIVEDGFWINDPDLPSGTTIRCEWTARGAQNGQDCIYSPGPDGMFIFTGMAPENVSVVRGGSAVPPPMPPRPSRSSRGDHGFHQPPDPRPFREPPAY